MADEGPVRLGAGVVPGLGLRGPTVEDGDGLDVETASRPAVGDIDGPPPDNGTSRPSVDGARPPGLQIDTDTPVGGGVPETGVLPFPSGRVYEAAVKAFPSRPATATTDAARAPGVPGLGPVPVALVTTPCGSPVRVVARPTGGDGATGTLVGTVAGGVVGGAAPTTVAPVVEVGPPFQGVVTRLGHLDGVGGHTPPVHDVVGLPIPRPRRPEETDAAPTVMMATLGALGRPSVVRDVGRVLATLVVRPTPVVGRRVGQAARPSRATPPSPFPAGVPSSDYVSSLDTLC